MMRTTGYLKGGLGVGSDDGTAILGPALGFTADDLESNRAGRLSEAQHELVLSHQRRANALTAVSVLIFLVFFGVIAAIVIPQVSNQKGSGSSSEVPLVIGVLVLMVVLLGLSALRTRRNFARRTGGLVSRVEGPAKTRVHHIHGNIASGVPYGGGIRYELTIDHVMFIMPSHKVLDLFEAGAPYRGYYVGKARGTITLLSAERVAGPVG